MARRPFQHVAGDQGVAEVVRALTSEGWACDINHSDYGEDLVCQTEFEGEVDAYRILIQVKTITKALDGPELSIRIDTETIRKWLSSPNLVVLCVWSIAEQTILYAIPSDQFDVSEAARSTRQTLAVCVQREKILDSKAISNLSWTARIQNLSRQFAELDARGRFLQNEFYTVGLQEYDRDVAIKKCERAMSEVAAQFLIYIDLFQKTNSGWTTAYDSFAEDMVLLGAGPIKDLGLEIDGLTSLHELLAITLWVRAHRVLSFRGHIPRNLLSGATRLYAHYLINEYAQIIKSTKDIESRLLAAAHDLCMGGASLSPSQVIKFVEFLKQPVPEGRVKIVKMEISTKSDSCGRSE